MVQFRFRPLSERNGRRSDLIILIVLCQIMVWLSPQYIQANSQPSSHTSTTTAAELSLELSYYTSSSIHPHDQTLSDRECDLTPTHHSDDQHWLRWRQPILNHANMTFTLSVVWFGQNQPLHSSQSQICQFMIHRHLRQSDSKTMMQNTSDEWLECEITHLPRQIDMIFMLISASADDDLKTANTTLVRSSPFLRLAIPAANKPSESPAPIVMHPMSLTTNDTTNLTTIDRIANDTEVRQDFLLFSNISSQLNWAEAPDWGRADLSLCDWDPDIITCNPDRTLITELSLSSISFDLVGVLQISMDFNFIFQHLHSLTRFETGFVSFSTLDLTGQLNLNTIEIGEASTGSCDASRPSTIAPIYLPSSGPSSLEHLYIGSTCCSIVDLTEKSFPNMKVLSVGRTPLPFPLSIIAETMVSLTELGAEEALESETPDSQRRSGSVLTNYWLENLNTIHPFLIAISIGGSTRLKFDANFPIVHSESLISFSFNVNNQPYPSSMTNETLKYLPQLQYVSFTYLTYMVLPLTIFEFASSIALIFIDLTNTPVEGSLESLRSHANLTFIWMGHSKLSGELPLDIAAYWPHLLELFVNLNSLTGPVPSFANLPQLVSIDLHSNAFTSLPVNFLNNSLDLLISIDLSDNLIDSPLLTLNGVAPNLLSMDLSHNSFFGPLTTLCRTPGQVSTQLPALVSLSLNNNRLTGTIPVAIWSLKGKILLDTNLLFGSIPSPSVPTILDSISLDNNLGLSGQFPENLTATTFSLSYTSLSGPLVSLAAFDKMQPLKRLNLAFTQLSCPLDLSTASNLIELDIQSAGFGGCNINNQSEMNVHWDQLQVLDISNNEFKPFIFTIFPPLTVLRATSCGVTSLVPNDNSAPLNLQLLFLDNNIFNADQSNRLQRLFINSLSLSVISFQNCSLTSGVIQELIAAFSTLTKLSKLLLSSNVFIGEIPFFLFADNAVNSFALPTSIAEFDLSNNPGLVGNLPPAASGYTALQVIDVSGTSISGNLPQSWASFINLQRLSVDHTQLVCSDQDSCPLPSWLTPSALISTSTSIQGAHCPQLVIRSSSLTLVEIDEEYYHHSLCTCDEKYFGLGSTCKLCPVGCSCVGNQIQNCFPIVTTSSTVISIPFILSCPLTLTGESLCNPNNVEWNFNSSTFGTGGADLTSFCYSGHTGRGCTRCIDGYFASGRWCLECGSNGLHIFIVIINLGLLILLIGIIYSQLPEPTRAMIQMENYFRSIDSTASFQHARSPSHRWRASTIHVVQQDTARSSSSPLKLLIFHSQQLGLILHTVTSQPQVLTGFLSLVSSGSSGFSLSSLISLECLNHSWSIHHQVWMSLLAPVLVGLACAFIYLYHQYRRLHAASVGSVSPTIESSLDPSRDTIRPGPDSSSSSSIPVTIPNESITPTSLESGILLNFPRMYGVCLALLYFFLFPCAQAVLSAIACTDARQYDGSSNESSSLYLNLLPWIACDSSWRHVTLPPAIVGVVLWVIAFPIFTTLLTRYLIVQIRVTKDPHLWPLCSDLFTRFKPKYWYYEQILLARRLSLVLAITIIPSDSLYLPVALFSIVQLSALVQHFMEPYQSVWLNRGELVSLYLLLLNYITTLVLHESTLGASSNSGGHSLDTWSVLLFLANLLFVLILIGALFLGFQNKLLQIANRILTFFDKSTKSVSISHVNHMPDSDGMIELNPYHFERNHNLDHSIGVNGTATSDGHELTTSASMSHDFSSNDARRPQALSLPSTTNPTDRYQESKDVLS